MAKIFQLELFIRELTIWELPSKCDERDETFVELTMFDIKDVSIKKEAFDKNRTLNRGQNFLFTLHDLPTTSQKMFFNIFKKTNKMGKRFLGTAKIPIDENFGDVFLQTFCKNDWPKVQRQQSVDDDPLPEHGPPYHSPISKLTKDVYPIIGADSKQYGMVCILMRLTSFGYFSAHQIHLHQNHKEIIIQSTPNTALYKRVPVDALRKDHLYGIREHCTYISAFPSNSETMSLIYNRGQKKNDFSFQCNETDISKDSHLHGAGNDDTNNVKPIKTITAKDGIDTSTK